MTVVTEGELVLDFSQALAARKLDADGEGRPTGWKSCDFLVEEANQLFVIEVKDPSNSKSTEEERAKKLAHYKSAEFVNDVAVPKAKDTYFCLHLMEQDKKPIQLILV